ncbi:MAG: rhomboid family intramembrane serine protease [bacterium]
MAYLDPSGGYRLRWGMTPCVLTLLALNVGLFLAYGLIDAFLPGLLPAYFGLSVSGIMLGRLWQPLTYMFLHASPLHLLFNMFSLFMFGPEVERVAGARRFLIIYFLSGILGGIAWLAITYPHAGLCIGASGGIFGLLAAFAVLFPESSMMIFPFPVAIKTWILVAGLAFIQFLYLVSPGGGNVAYAAHLAGAIVGFGYTMRVFRPGRLSTWFGARWGRRRPMHSRGEDSATQQEVDRILDKIATQGVHALSERERKVLEKASSHKRSGR